MTIEMTQYLRPDGRRRLIHIDLASEIEEKVDEIRRLGAELEAEVLTTGEVCFTVEKQEELIGMEVVNNDYRASTALIALIVRSHHYLTTTQQRV